MNRRRFLKIAASGAAAVATSRPLPLQPVPTRTRYDREYFRKQASFEENHPSDVHVGADELSILHSTVSRLRRIQSQVGHGNFQILGFDSAIRLARRHAAVGTFTERERAFLEAIFHEDASRYGFYGEKVWTRLTDTVRERDLIKIPGTGQYLLRGKSFATYHEIKGVIGGELMLTSGVRGIVKQTFLFLDKTLHTEGNLSRASRSLAPPGYSFHAIGDFDVGKRGLGRRNFTTSFAETDVYGRLADLGYVEIRYPRGNLFGVRFEPWHIKVAARNSATSS